MNRKIVVVFALIFGMWAVHVTRAQSAYFNAVTNLNPVGYWPLQESGTPAAATIETNYGTMGALGTAYYAATNSSFAAPNTPGALTNSTDPAVHFSGSAGWMFVPRVSPVTQVKPPCTLEFWYKGAAGAGFQDILGQGGSGLNNFPNKGNAGGFRVSYGGKSPGGPNLQIYVFTGSGQTRPSLQLPGGSMLSNQWNYCVITFDGTLASMNVTMYVNGVNDGNKTFKMGSDTWSPLAIGSAWWRNYGPSNHGNGDLDEVAMYTNVLSQQEITDHYLAATTPGSNYVQAVLSGSPLLYYRMDFQDFTNVPAAFCPVATNYGSASVNGAYLSGTQPGAVAGPSVNGSNNVAAPINGVTGCIDAGNDAAFDPTGTQPFTAACWFKGNPGDDRIMGLMSQGSDWALNLVGTNGTVTLTDGAGSVVSTSILNDGYWHFVVGVYDGVNNYLYVDGALNNATAASGTLAGDASHDMYVGGNAAYTLIGGNQQYLAGAIAQAAFFTNALTAGQVATLYNSSAVPPAITQQPASVGQINGGSGTTASFNVVASGAGLNYQWYFNTSSSYSGATALVAGTHYLNPNTSGLTVSNLTASDSGYYFVVITNDYASVTSELASATVYVNPQILSQSPEAYTNPITLFAGANPTFSVTAVGEQPLSYQWYSNSVAVAGATNASFTMTNVQVGSDSVYCGVANSAGSTSSSTWSLSVIAAPTAPFPVAVLADHPIGYWRLNEGPDNYPNNGVIAKDYVGGNNGIYTNTDLAQPGYSPTTDPSETAALFGYNAFSNSLVYGIQNVDFSAPLNSNSAFSVAAWVQGYQQTLDAGIVSKGVSSKEQFDLDTGANATNATQSLIHNFRFFVRDANGKVYPVNSYVNMADNQWHLLVGVCNEAAGYIAFYVDGALVGTNSIAPGSGILASSDPVKIGSRPGTTDPNYNNAQLQASSVDDVSAYNYALSASQVQGLYSASGTAPTFVQEPVASTNVDENGTLIVSSLATGSTPLHYQWYDGNTAVAIPGQTNRTLVLSNITTSDTAFYATVNNNFGSATSTYVYVNVLTGPPQISANLPVNLYVLAGQSYTYSVSVTGTEPFSYQWYANAAPVTGATDQNLTIGSVPLGSTTYYVTVTNINGAVASAISTLTGVELTNSYTGDIQALNPAGYWPLQETNAPAAATIETNYGTLGALGNAYYAGPNPAYVTLGATGALTNSGDNDASTYFTGANSGGGSQDYLFVPRISPALTLKAPFTLECWFLTTNSGFGDLIGEGGSGLNTNVNQGNAGGVRLSYGGASNPNIQAYIFNGNGQVRNQLASPANSAAPGQWHYIVLTYDGSIATLYIDGVYQASGAYTMALDTWSPLTMGAGFWRGRGSSWVSGNEDEVAVYPNVLSAQQVTDHYLAATTPGSNYVQAVLSDQPLLYYRMDAPFITNVPAAFCPVATNYGSAPVNGSYLSGTRPGFVAGPPIAGLANGVASPINGVNSCIDAGFDSSFDPTGTQPFTAMCWFKGNPADQRIESLMSQGSNWGLEVVGTSGLVAFANGAGSVTSANVLNDGQWHFVAGVYDGTTNYLYVDGALNNSAAASGSLAGDATSDLYLGGNAVFPFTGDNSQQYFAGDLTQATFVNGALSAQLVQQIYQSSVQVPINPNPTNIVFSVTGNQLTLSWPADHTGWTLQAQTNSLGAGLGTNWVDVSGSTTTNMIVVPINPGNGTVFYRMVLP